MDKINLDKIISDIYVTENSFEEYPEAKEWIKRAMIEFGKQLLIVAANKATAIYGQPVDKHSILDVINRVE